MQNTGDKCSTTYEELYGTDMESCEEPSYMLYARCHVPYPH